MTGLAPESMWDVLLMPLLFTFFGLAVRGAAAAYRNNTGLRPKPLPVLLGTFIPLAFALWFGLRWMYQLFSPNDLDQYLYRQSGITRKILYSHWLSVLLPLAAIVGVIL